MLQVMNTVESELSVEGEKSGERHRACVYPGSIHFNVSRRNIEERNLTRFCRSFPTIQSLGVLLTASSRYELMLGAHSTSISRDQPQRCGLCRGGDMAPN